MFPGTVGNCCVVHVTIDKQILIKYNFKKNTKSYQNCVMSTKMRYNINLRIVFYKIILFIDKCIC
jgi:hypothetical protein